MGPSKHCVLYPLKGGSEYNLVLIRPDNLPPGISKIQGEIDEMRETFKGWDITLTKIISRIPTVLKWRICTLEELETWSKASYLNSRSQDFNTFVANASNRAMSHSSAMPVTLPCRTRLKEQQWLSKTGLSSATFSAL
jgi:hypothetical protein